MKKVCTRCKKEKDLCEFSLHRNKKDKRQLWCKECNHLYRKEKAILDNIPIDIGREYDIVDTYDRLGNDFGKLESGFGIAEYNRSQQNDNW